MQADRDVDVEVKANKQGEMEKGEMMSVRWMCVVVVVVAKDEWRRDAMRCTVFNPTNTAQSQRESRKGAVAVAVAVAVAEAKACVPFLLCSQYCSRTEREKRKSQSESEAEAEAEKKK